jgi:hypothetical protein
MVALPPPFLRRKKLAHGQKIVIQDCVDFLNVKCIDEKTMQEIDLDNKQRYNLYETKRLKIISKTYRQQKINRDKHGGVKWQNAKYKT